MEWLRQVESHLQEAEGPLEAAMYALKNVGESWRDEDDPMAAYNVLDNLRDKIGRMLDDMSDIKKMLAGGRR